jgi:hypothetical protein
VRRGYLTKANFRERAVQTRTATSRLRLPERGLGQFKHLPQARPLSACASLSSVSRLLPCFAMSSLTC